ncbi:MAG: GRAM domain-containing protein [Halobacteriota archaeon]
MGDIGAWWVANHTALPDESLTASFYCNYLRPQGRPLGGKLYVTDMRVLFSPHLLDAVLGGDAFDIDLESVDRVTDAPISDRQEGAEKALAIVLADGTRESFVISDLQTAIEELSLVLST